MEVENSVEDVFDNPALLAGEEDTKKTEETTEESHSPKGYMTREAWIEAGKDPEKWVSPEVFKERGERIKMKQELTREFESRLKNLSLLHEVQLKNVREELMAKRDAAIESADKDEVKRLDKQIKEVDDLQDLAKAEEVQPVEKPREVAEWEEENPWIFDQNDPRRGVAISVFEKAVKEGKTHATALRMVDKVLSEKFTDPTKRPGQIAESSRSTGVSKGTKLTMASLTSEEKKIWETGMFSSEEKFLKAVEDDRKAKKL